MSHSVNKPRPTRLQRAIHQWFPLLLIALCLPSCSRSTDDMDPQPPTPDIATANHYINLSIVVSSGSQGTMRAPLGGENGDGREAGYAYENEVKGITFILYKTNDNEGINTEDDNAKIEFIQYYPVKFVNRENPGTSFDKNKTEEAVYTTDDQPINGLDLTGKYHAIVVANRNLIEDGFKKGTPITKEDETTKGVREHIVSKIYDGTGIATKASNFVMASESDFTVDFSKPENVTKETIGNKTYFHFGDIFIERLAARVDFWAKGATYNSGKGGYVYKVKSAPDDASPDEFVLTAVTPFNLYDKDEYIIKRITEDKNFESTEYDLPAKFLYLEDERRTTGKEHRNFVIDPLTGSKTGDMITEGYMKAGYTLDDFFKTESTYDDMRMSMSSHYFRKDDALISPNASLTDNEETGDNMIICYPKENTLWVTTPLYYYATGLCIEGIYYKNGESTGEPLKYYGFLRHQGEATNSGHYEIVKKEGLEEYKEYNSIETFPMNFGVVRNNIYRVSIDEITKKTDKEPPSITWRIMVKNWDVFTHKTIFM